MKNYKIIKKNQFACSLMQVRRDKKMPVALLKESDKAIISQAYPVFEVIDKNLLLPEYLMMWLSRREFDRHALFLAVGGVRGSLEWEDFCDIQLPIPTIEKQQEIVAEYNTITDRIKLNEQLNQKLEQSAQAIYKEWFVDFGFPDENGRPYKSSGGKIVWCEELGKEVPEGWEVVDLCKIIEIKYGKDYKHLEDGKIPLYGSGGIMKYVNKPIYEKQSILIPRKGSLDNILYINKPFWTVDTMFYSKIKIDYHSKYIFYFLKTIDFYMLNVGSAVPSMTTSILNNIRVLLSKDDLLKKFDNYVKLMFEHKNNLIRENNKLYHLKDALLSKMATIEDIRR